MQVLSNQGAMSQFENIYDDNLNNASKYTAAFTEKIGQELSVLLKDSSKVDPSPMAMQASHFGPIALIDNLVNPTAEKATLPVSSFSTITITLRATDPGLTGLEFRQVTRRSRTP